MPIVQVNLIQGRSEEQKSAMIREVAHAISQTLDAPIDTVRVMINELPSSNWGMGPVTAKSKGR
ncbi:MAG TPA: 2-hydroxymuconate tautomerase [Novosphingobium sp.]|nr:2-hydroxymuconate tautomerase [Novosphingobium sp.]HZV09260.1 2-hydroxymuconate tautomerase [Novosphingobium sp.]